MKKEPHAQLVRKVFERWQLELDEARKHLSKKDDKRKDRRGEALDYPEWYILSGDSEYYTIAEEKFDEIRLLTVWIGREGHEYCTFVFENDALRALSVCATEHEAEWLHARLIFMIEQKIWSFDE